MRPIKIDLHTYDKGKGHLSIKEQNILRAIVFKCSTPIICYNLTFHPNELDLFILYFLFAILQSGKVLKQVHQFNLERFGSIFFHRHIALFIRERAKRLHAALAIKP